MSYMFDLLGVGNQEYCYGYKPHYERGLEHLSGFKVVNALRISVYSVRSYDYFLYFT